MPMCACSVRNAIRWCDRRGRASMVCVVRDRRLPPQGGLPPVDGIGGTVVEIGCDESGFSGSNLLDAATPVFTHASVDLGLDEAAELIGGLRQGQGLQQRLEVRDLVRLAGSGDLVLADDQ